jgi:hypothetical protein
MDGEFGPPIGRAQINVFFEILRSISKCSVKESNRLSESVRVVVGDDHGRSRVAEASNWTRKNGT